MGEGKRRERKRGGEVKGSEGGSGEKERRREGEGKGGERTCVRVSERDTDKKGRGGGGTEEKILRERKTDG